jgi:hypothetical protein
MNTEGGMWKVPQVFGTDVLAASGPEVAVVDSGDGEHLVIGPETCVWVRG